MIKLIFAKPDKLYMKRIKKITIYWFYTLYEFVRNIMSNVIYKNEKSLFE